MALESEQSTLTQQAGLVRLARAMKGALDETFAYDDFRSLLVIWQKSAGGITVEDVIRVMDEQQPPSAPSQSFGPLLDYYSSVDNRRYERAIAATSNRLSAVGALLQMGQNLDLEPPDTKGRTPPEDADAFLSPDSFEAEEAQVLVEALNEANAAADRVLAAADDAADTFHACLTELRGIRETVAESNRFAAAWSGIRERETVAA